MGGEWTPATLGEMANLRNGKGLKNSFYKNSGKYPVWGANGQIARTDELLNEQPVIVIGRVGAYCGSIHAVFEPNSVTDNAIVIRPRKGNDFRFLFYLLKYLKPERTSIGSAQPLVTQTGLKILEYLKPPLPEQRAIAHILGSLDDKIELNRRMNKTLEATARAIFKSWFIDFDPVKRNIARKAGQNQPSPPTPLPEVEGRKVNYRGGYNYSGLIETVRKLRNKQTPAEAVFWEMLRDRRFMGLKFRRQHQLRDYVVDFYCHEYRLVVELDGGIHASKQKKDHKRDAWMEAQGFTVLRFPNEHVLEDPQSVLEQIDAYCTPARGAGVLPSPSGRRAGDEGVLPSPSGRRAGDEGCVEAFDALFPDSFEDSEMGEIPNGWKSRSLYESAKYINGAAYRNFHFTDEEGALPVIKIAELKNGVSGQTKFTKTELDDKYRISDGEILLSWSGNPDTSIGTFVWCGGPAWLNQHTFRVLPHQEIEKHFVFYLLKYLRPVFAEIARDKQTTGLGHFTARDMKQLMVVHPPENILAVFNDSVGPMFDRWYGNLFESNTLASLRHTLLPKLISGELRVPDAEKFVDEAGV